VDGILIRPDDGETIARGPRNHRILAELPELEVVELQFGPDFEGVGRTAMPTTSTRSTCSTGSRVRDRGRDLSRRARHLCRGPIGVVHGFRNAGDGDLRMLNVHAPNTGLAGRLRRA